jgi:NAD(P)-dependent dehydrogenase (short-subunit alcohol dehydrogenase family)
MRLIVVTGASTGIGRACAEHYSRQGWTVVGTARDPQRLVDVVWPGPGTVHLEPLDLETPGSGAAFAEVVLARYGVPDVVLANAGMVQFGPIETAQPEQIERIFRVNTFEQVGMAVAFVPAMRERGSGTIALVTSLGGRMTFPFFGIYNASKHALEGFAEGMWHELKASGIRVKAIEPGFVETAIWGKALPERPEDLDAPEQYRAPMLSMLKFEEGISDRTTPEKAAEEIAAAIADGSDRLRYPVAAYARPILAARRLLGGQRLMRFFHKRWLG